MAYCPGFSLPDQGTPQDGWKPLWPPQNLSSWSSDYPQVDYFSHIQRPEGVDNADDFQWDGLADDSGTIVSWEETDPGKLEEATPDMAVFQLTQDGRILISDFTTPDAGSYAEPEIGLTGFFEGNNDWYNITFMDFAIQFFGPESGNGGFAGAIQQ